MSKRSRAKKTDAAETKPAESLPPPPPGGGGAGKSKVPKTFSLIDVMHARFFADDRERLSRLLYVAECEHGQEDEITAQHQTFVEKAVSDFQIPVSGLMLLQQSSMVNLVELDPDAVPGWLASVEAMTGEGKPFKSVRVLVCSEACPSRLFPAWEVRRLVLAKEGDIDFESDDVTSIGFQVYHNLLKMGAKLPKTNASEALDALKKNHSLLLPSDDRVKAFAHRPEFFSAQGFLDAFAKPAQVSLESDMVWPMQQVVPST